jgi:hydrogenase maturation protease
MRKTEQVCVVGVGNPDCGDDSVGPLIIQKLEQDGLNEIRLIKVSGETAGLIEIFAENKIVILVDAIASANQPGTIHRFDATGNPLPSEMFSNYSTHSMGVNEAIEMARALENLPERIIVYGIEGVSFDPGESMCPEVRDHFEELTNRMRKEISTLHSITHYA